MSKSYRLHKSRFTLPYGNFAKTFQNNNIVRSFDHVIQGPMKELMKVLLLTLLTMKATASRNP